MWSRINRVLDKRIFNRLPVTLKVTLWYTFFIVLLFAGIISASFVIGQQLLSSITEHELTNTMSDISTGRRPFKPFDDGVYYSIYSGRQKVDGALPIGFDIALPMSNGIVSSYENENMTYLYLDMYLPSEATIHHREWLRGVVPLTKLRSTLTLIPLGLAMISPLLILIIVYGGYKIIKRGFRPVSIVAQTAWEIGEQRDFSRRIELGEGNDEIHQMAMVFNKMLESLEGAYKREQRFSSDVSHELRTPTAVMQAESEYGLEYAETLEEAKESLAVLNRQSKRMRNLINQILELSRLDQIDKIDCEQFNLSAELVNLASDYKVLAESRQLKLTLNIEPDIDIRGNIGMIERLVDNLVSNALKFTDTRIGINLAVKDKMACLQICDDGIGIPEEVISKIWDRFYQVDYARNKNQYGGAGLGLSMVQKIVELHRGRISVSSTKEQTVFSVELPLA